MITAAASSQGSSARTCACWGRGRHDRSGSDSVGIQPDRRSTKSRACSATTNYVTSLAIWLIGWRIRRC